MRPGCYTHKPLEPVDSAKSATQMALRMSGVCFVEIGGIGEPVAKLHFFELFLGEVQAAPEEADVLDG